MMTITANALQMEVIDPFAGSAWDEEVLGNSAATIFHESVWARVLSDTYGHVPCYLRFTKGARLVALVALMEVGSWARKTRAVGLPFSDACPPLVFQREDMDEVLTALKGMSLKRGWRYVELRGGTQELQKPFDEAATFLGHELSLAGDEESQFAQLSSAARRSIKKAQRSGFTVTVSESWSAFQKFFLLHERTRRRHGVPPQPLSFFRNIQRLIFDSGKGFVTLVERGGEPVAGAVFLSSAHRAVYKFGASDERQLEDRPNHLAIWEGIRTLISRECPLLDFGRTARSQEGLCRFKRSWGAREIDLCYLRSDRYSDGWEVREEDSSSALTAGFRFMPLPINRLAGKFLYPHLD